MPVNVHPAEQMYWRMLNWLRLREWCRGSASMVMAPCYAFKRALTDRFPEDVVNDDVHVAWRVGCLGQAIGLAGSVVQEVRGTQTGAGLFRQKVRRGAGMLREMFRFVPASGGMPPPLRAAFAIRLALFLLGPVLAIATVAWALAVLTSLPAVDAGAAVGLAACTAGLLVWPREGSRVRRPLALLALLTASTTASLLLYPIFGPTGSFSIRTGRAASQKPVSGL